MSQLAAAQALFELSLDEARVAKAMLASLLRSLETGEKVLAHDAMQDALLGPAALVIWYVENQPGTTVIDAIADEDLVE